MHGWKPSACVDETPLCDDGSSSCIGCTYHEQCGSGACRIATDACFEEAQVYDVGPEQTYLTITDAVADLGEGVQVVLRLHDPTTSYNESVTIGGFDTAYAFRDYQGNLPQWANSMTMDPKLRVEDDAEAYAHVPRSLGIHLARGRASDRARVLRDARKLPLQGEVDAVMRLQPVDEAQKPRAAVRRRRDPRPHRTAVGLHMRRNIGRIPSRHALLQRLAHAMRNVRPMPIDAVPHTGTPPQRDQLVGDAQRFASESFEQQVGRDAVRIEHAAGLVSHRDVELAEPRARIWPSWARARSWRPSVGGSMSTMSWCLPRRVSPAEPAPSVRSISASASPSRRSCASPRDRSAARSSRLPLAPTATNAPVAASWATSFASASSPQRRRGAVA